MRSGTHTTAGFAARLAADGLLLRSPGPPQPPAPAARPSILLVTLDTTRADAIGPGAKGIETPAFNALAARGRHFRQAYATVPETLPSHISMMTGLYPGGHGVHENARFLGADQALLAESLGRAGYRTAAFISSFVLSRRFGLSRGFAHYDDELPGAANERDAAATTDRALAYLAEQDSSTPLFIWVHYFDPHAPYEPPSRFRTRYPTPYLGEVAAVDEQLGRLTQAFEARRHAAAMIVAGDHGEGLGDHGEAQHGHLLYQSTMHVPLVIVGPGVGAATIDDPISTRRVFYTALDWAGQGSSMSLRGSESEVVLGEAMKPFLEYGWRPQTMAVSGGMKAIQAGTIEAYDLAADPGEAKNLGSGANLPPGVRKSLDDYPIPSLTAAKAPAGLDEDARRRLASLGYISATAAPVVRPDAPRPADMTRLIEVIERASALFVQERYAAAIPLFEQILAADANNLDATLRLAVSHSLLGHSRRRWTRSGGRFVSRPIPPTCARISVCTTRGQPDRSGGAAARTGGGRVAPAGRCRRRAGRRSGAARKDRGGGRALSAGVSPSADDGAGAGSSRRAGDERAADAGGNWGVREGARDRGGAVFATISSSVCSTCRPATSTRRVRRSIASRCHIPSTPWPCSSAPR